MTIEEQKTLKIGDKIWYNGSDNSKPCWVNITMVTEYAICGRFDGQPNISLCILHENNQQENKARTYYSLAKPK